MVTGILNSNQGGSISPEMLDHILNIKMNSASNLDQFDQFRYTHLWSVLDNRPLTDDQSIRGVDLQPRKPKDNMKRRDGLTGPPIGVIESGLF